MAYYKIEIISRFHLKIQPLDILAIDLLLRYNDLQLLIKVNKNILKIKNLLILINFVLFS